MYPQSSLLALMFVALMAVANSRSVKIASSVCFVADHIQIHNTNRFWWWSQKGSRPSVTHRPAGPHHHKEWMVFTDSLRSYSSSGKLLEIAHKMPGQDMCRFLLHSQGRSNALRMSRPSACRPGQFGEQGLFNLKFDPLTYLNQLTVGSQPATVRDSTFLGVRGRFLRPTSIRARDMQFWDIKFNPSKQC